MKEITEKQAYELAEGVLEWPVLIKEEDEQTESAVTLKKFPTGYILGVSCDNEDLFKIFFCENLDEIMPHCKYYLEKLRTLGNPFSE